MKRLALRGFRFLTLILLAVVSSSSVLEAADWEGSINLGFTGATGNSNTTNSHLSIEAEAKGARLTSRYRAGSTYAKSDGSTDTNRSDASAHFSYGLQKSRSVYLEASAERDEIAGLDWRTTVGPGLGYALIDRESLSLTGELGLSYLRQKYENEEIDEYMSLRVAERGVWRKNDKARLWQSVEYTPAIKHFSNRYILNAEAGIEDSVTSTISLRLVVRDTYNSAPPEDTDKNDLTFIAAVGFRF